MDAVESFYIFCKTMLNNQINNKLTVKHNIIFETIIREDPHRGIYDTCSMQQQIPSQFDPECYVDTQDSPLCCTSRGQPPPASAHFQPSHA